VKALPHRRFDVSPKFVAASEESAASKQKSAQEKVFAQAPSRSGPAISRSVHAAPTDSFGHGHLNASSQRSQGHGFSRTPGTVVRAGNSGMVCWRSASTSKATA